MLAFQVLGTLRAAPNVEETSVVGRGRKGMQRAADRHRCVTLTNVGLWGSPGFRTAQAANRTRYSFGVR
jgi:hypothetical protein